MRQRQQKDAREKGRIILAWGEVTHHHHEVVVAETGLAPDHDAAMFVELADGTRELMVLAPCELRHQEHGVIALDADEAARGARGERDEHGRIRGQYRQGDVFLQPIGHGTWTCLRQREGYSPDSWRQVAD